METPFNDIFPASKKWKNLSQVSFKIQRRQKNFPTLAIVEKDFHSHIVCVCSRLTELRPFNYVILKSCLALIAFTVF
jgi:hypothetical protein